MVFTLEQNVSMKETRLMAKKIWRFVNQPTFAATEKKGRRDMMEEWRPIKGFETQYEISNIGRVRNAKGSVKKPFAAHGGYLMIDLYKNNIRTHARVNRLVAEAFIPNPENKPEVNHKDGDKKNNNVNNLEWNTKSENMLHAYRKRLQTKGQYPVREVICINDQKVYATAGEAARAYGLNANTVTSCCRRLSNRGNLTFRYIERRSE